MASEQIVQLKDAKTRRNLIARIDSTWRRDPGAPVQLVFVQLAEAKRLADLVGHCTWQVIPRVLFEQLQRGNLPADLFWLEVFTWAVWTEAADNLDRISIGPSFITRLATELHDHEMDQEAAETETARQGGISDWERTLTECNAKVSVFPGSLRLQGPTSEGCGDRLESLFKKHCQVFDPLPWPREMVV